MGAILSNNRDQQLITELQTRLTNLENIDHNSDGLVSKDEYESWTKQQEQNLKLFQDTILKVRDTEHQLVIQKLEHEINTLRRINADLESRLINKNSTPRTTIVSNNKLFGELSRAFIENEINKLLTNSNINVNIIPDYYEKMIYRNPPSKQTNTLITDKTRYSSPLPKSLTIKYRQSMD